MYCVKEGKCITLRRERMHCVMEGKICIVLQRERMHCVKEGKNACVKEGKNALC